MVHTHDFEIKIDEMNVEGEMTLNGKTEIDFSQIPDFIDDVGMQLFTAFLDRLRKFSDHCGTIDKIEILKKV